MKTWMFLLAGSDFEDTDLARASVCSAKVKKIFRRGVARYVLEKIDFFSH